MGMGCFDLATRLISDSILLIKLVSLYAKQRMQIKSSTGLRGSTVRRLRRVGVAGSSGKDDRAERNSEGKVANSESLLDVAIMPNARSEAGEQFERRNKHFTAKKNAVSRGR